MVRGTERGGKRQEAGRMKPMMTSRHILRRWTVVKVHDVTTVVARLSIPDKIDVRVSTSFLAVWFLNCFLYVMCNLHGAIFTCL